MPWNDGLDGSALRIASSTESPLRINAGPGTGKTFATMRRVARLLEDGANPERIFVVTFTRTAARDLISALSRLEVPGSALVRATTLHSFCFRTLGKAAALEATGRVPRPLLNFEVRFLEEDLKRPGTRGLRECREYTRAFEASWARLQDDVPGWPLKPEEREFHNEMIDWLKFHRCMLIGELVSETRNYLRNNPVCPERQMFDHILVDEYQDLNRADQEVIDLLAENGTLTVIGDEDQAIYSRLRYAQPESIREFPASHPGTADIPLDICRRCPRTVVEIANSVISHNSLREPRELQPFAGNPDGDVRILQWDTLEDEADGLAAIIEGYLAANDVARGDVLVLAPRRVLGYQIRDRLNARGIDAHSYFNEEALDTTAARERFTLLSLLADPEDRVAFRCWLGFGHDGLRKTEYGRLRELADALGVGPREALERVRRGDVSVKGSDRLIDRLNLLEAEVTRMSGLVDDDLVDALFPDENDDVAHIRFLGLASVYYATEQMDAKALLDDLRTRIIYPEPPPLADFVRIMSLYKAKGLTAKLVIVAGLVEGWVPTLDDSLSGDEAKRNVEEQRRLFYVSLTRATDTLVLSSFGSMPVRDAHRMQIRSTRVHGNRAYGLASRFLSELGPSAPPPRRGTKIV